jgi:hypothetical protein
MDQRAVEAAAQEIHDNMQRFGHLQKAVTEMWVNSGHDTPLMEAAFAKYQETH